LDCEDALKGSEIHDISLEFFTISFYEWLGHHDTLSTQ